jgi:hypothetical protein
MEISEKTRVILAAVHVAAAKGFDFLDWYKRTLNIIPSGAMTEETRIKHMCTLGIEKMLLIDIEFLQLLLKKWEKFVLRFIIEKEPLWVLRGHLVNTGVLSE